MAVPKEKPKTREALQAVLDELWTGDLPPSQWPDWARLDAFRMEIAVCNCARAWLGEGGHERGCPAGPNPPTSRPA